LYLEERRNGKVPVPSPEKDIFCESSMEFPWNLKKIKIFEGVEPRTPFGQASEIGKLVA